MQYHLSTAACALLLLGLASCGPAAQDSTNPGEPEQSPSRLLHTLNLSPEHRLEFYDYDGSTGVLELRPYGTAGVMDTLIDAGGKENLPTTLSELYRMVGSDDEVLALLHDADVRAETQQALADDDEVKQGSQDVDTFKTFNLEAPSAAAGSCSADEYGDGWGGQWFTDKYCLPMRGPGGNVCSQNIASYDSGTYTQKASPGYWKQMEGDFNQPGSVQIWFIDGRFNLPVVDEYIPARYILTWKLNRQNKKVHINASSPCNHLHFWLHW